MFYCYAHAHSPLAVSLLWRFASTASDGLPRIRRATLTALSALQTSGATSGSSTVAKLATARASLDTLASASGTDPNLLRLTASLTSAKDDGSVAAGVLLLTFTL